jgi:LmbE family N-acetylglucosaminyl deacetylase
MTGEKRIMVIGAHAADAELMGGAAVLAHHALGWKSVLVHMTLGEKGGRNISPEEYAKVKRAQAEAAAAILGSDVEFLPYLDGELPVDEEVQWLIADLIRKYKPDVILTHWKGSIHVDHTNTYENVLASIFFAALPTFRREHEAHWPRAIYFAENWEDEEEYTPDTYLDVSDVWDTFERAAACYTLVSGPNPPFRYAQWYDGASRMRGAERGVDRAVALLHHRPFYSRRYLKESLG